MHYCLVTYGSRGDVQPFIALALGLMANGHTVTLAAPGNFKPLADSYGVNIYPLYGDVEVLVNSSQLRKSISTGSNITFVRSMLKETHNMRGPLFDGICEACKTADAMIVVNTCIFYVAAIGEKFNKRWLIVQLNPPMIPTKAFPMLMFKFPDISWLNPYSYRIINSVLWQVSKKDNAEFRQRVGLAPLKGSLYDKILHDKVPMIHAYSPELIAKPFDWEEYFTISGFFTLPKITNDKRLPVALPDGLTEWLNAGTKPLYIGFGSIPFPDEKKLAGMINDILATSTTRIVYCLGWSPSPELKSHPNLLVIRQADHSWLLPKCCAAIIHGGIGTVAAVLKAGIPAIVASIFVDQPAWGKIIEQKKLGVHIPWRKLSAAVVLKALTKLKQSHIAETIKEASSRVNKEDGVGAAVKMIEAYCNI
ncbi:glycosyltransferase [Mucilaginibacter sp. X5P1]|uniref:glycosyltransferase n=1 Tax=Mucilaginibacter sp. X5P1 TaxID=2723088 RepID=UPI00160CFEB8|nr:glycosyltransferase [Mucilaginibacter sp. X5P1]MBB6141757.1 UDP:flavonoid glycosyltransferase YjiC (YdhE family) [Mucilaginibacter sp. X5P1]